VKGDKSLNENEKLLANIVSYLIENGDCEAASYLVLCDNIEYVASGTNDEKVVLSGPPALVKLFRDASSWGWRADQTNYTYEAWEEDSIQFKMNVTS